MIAKGELIASTRLFEQTALKQNLVTRLSRALNFGTLPKAKPLQPALGIGAAS